MYDVKVGCRIVTLLLVSNTGLNVNARVNRECCSPKGRTPRRTRAGSNRTRLLPYAVGESGSEARVERVLPPAVMLCLTQNLGFISLQASSCFHVKNVT